ncbi:STE-3-like pheromone receptor [Rhizoctonia solani]|nr:STE-3-like pheromone receptor [Rhizoctonia solani]
MRLDLPIVSFICTVLVLIPLPWHWRARNIPTLSLIFWLTVVNFPRGINAIICAGDKLAYVLVWCDITTKLTMGASYAYASAAVCICRNLAHVCSPYYTIPNAAQRRTQTIFEICMCIVWPVIGMALHYVVQGNRFFVMEDFGCQPSIYVSIPAVFIVYLPPIVCGLATIVYSAISLRWLVHRRTQFQVALPSRPYGMTTERHLRLVALSITLMLSVTSMTVFVFVTNLTQAGLRPWISWDFVHEDWYHINQISKSIPPQSLWDHYLVGWYTVPFTSVIFFAFFGLGREAKDEYTKYARFLKTKILRIKPKERPVLPISGNIRPNSTGSVITPAVVLASHRTSISITKESKEVTSSSSTLGTSHPPSRLLVTIRK